MVRTNMVSLLDQALQLHPTLLKRGLTPDDLQRHNVWADEQLNIHIPVYNALGSHEFTVIRTANGKPKYLFVPDRAREYPFNINMITHMDPRLPLLIEESPFDSITSYPRPSVALIGLAVNKKAEFLLSIADCSGYIIALDPDFSGISAAAQAATLMSFYKPTIIYYDTNLYDDYPRIAQEMAYAKAGRFLIYGTPVNNRPMVDL